MNENQNLDGLNGHGTDASKRENSPFDTSSNASDDDVHTNLIVNYLPQSMKQDEFVALFSAVGDLKSAHLVMNKNTGESLAYGFVNYRKKEDAEKAINNLNGLKLGPKVIKVSHARPSSDEIKGANLYIAGLPKNMPLQQLEALFGKYGSIINSKVINDSIGGVGFIRFDKRIQAETAMKELNGNIPPGLDKPIVVKFANPTTAQAQNMIVQGRFGPGPMRYPGPGSMRIGSTNNRSNRFSPMGSVTPGISAPAPAPFYNSFDGNSGWCLYVYNLSPEVEEQHLWQLFGPFGAVQKVNIIRDPVTGHTKGYGFVTMTNRDDAEIAIHSLNGYTLDNRVLQVSFKTNKKR
uniref:ELAV-like protein 2 n=2 Tax=Lygus hesperus TaxID=30085 RepID=A0A0A9WFA6_LYGHE